MDTNNIGKQIKEISKQLAESRIKLDEDVFIERHLPVIALHGKPTESLQRELTLVAGGENKRIDLIGKDGKVAITLPSALSNGAVIKINSADKKNTMMELSTIDSNNNNPKYVERVMKNIEKTKTFADDIENSWSGVLEHYKDKIPGKQEKVKPHVEVKKEDDDGYDYDYGD